MRARPHRRLSAQIPTHITQNIYTRRMTRRGGNLHIYHTHTEEHNKYLNMSDILIDPAKRFGFNGFEHKPVLYFKSRLWNSPPRTAQGGCFVDY